MNFDPQVVLNEELPSQKYDSYSGNNNSVNTDTLDEPVIDTVVTSILQRKEISRRSTTRSPSRCGEKEITKKLSSNGSYGVLCLSL